MAGFQKILFEGIERGFPVDGIEDRFSQEEINAAVHQAARLVVVGSDERIEGCRPECGIVHIRRHRRGAICGSH